MHSSTSIPHFLSGHSSAPTLWTKSGSEKVPNSVEDHYSLIGFFSGTFYGRKLFENDEWLFSFENICEVLGFNLVYIRQRLLRWKKMKLEERPRPKVCLTAKGDGWSPCG